MINPRLKVTLVTGAHNLYLQARNSFQTHSKFIAIVISYTVASQITGLLYGVPEQVSLTLYYSSFVDIAKIFLLGFFAYYSLHTMIFVRPRNLTAYIVTDLKMNYLNIERLLPAFFISFFILIFLSAATSFKTIRPVINPFLWDTIFVQWDSLLHGNKQPWELLQPIIGHPLITSIINYFYTLWFFLMFLILIWQAFSLSNPLLRFQFFYSYLLAWILIGGVAANLFSSVGPCYYGRVINGEDIFKPLMDYLWATNEIYPIWALNVQESLWKSYENSDLVLGSGISAMPSMHVSIAFLFALLGWRTNRTLGILLSIFTLLILIGSVHLGWHYAIDGYVAIALTWLIWRAVGFTLKQKEKSIGT